MKSLSLKTLCMLLLGAWVAVAVSVSAFQSGSMAAKMAVSTEMDGGAQGGCDGCPDGDRDKAVACVSVCTVAGAAVLPTTLSLHVLQATDSPLPIHTVSRGRLSSPDPYPPKHRDL